MRSAIAVPVVALLGGAATVLAFSAEPHGRAVSRRDDTSLAAQSRNEFAITDADVAAVQQSGAKARKRFQPPKLSVPDLRDKVPTAPKLNVADLRDEAPKLSVPDLRDKVPKVPNLSVPDLRNKVPKLPDVKGANVNADALKAASGVAPYALGLAPFALAVRSSLVRTKKLREEEEERRRKEEEAKKKGTPFQLFNFNSTSVKPFNASIFKPPSVNVSAVKFAVDRELPVIDVPSVIGSAVGSATKAAAAKIRESNVTSNAKAAATRLGSNLKDGGAKQLQKLMASNLNVPKLNTADVASRLQKVNVTDPTTVAAGGLLAGLAALATRRSDGVSSSSKVAKEDLSSVEEVPVTVVEPRPSGGSVDGGGGRTTVAPAAPKTPDVGGGTAPATSTDAPAAPADASPKKPPVAAPAAPVETSPKKSEAATPKKSEVATPKKAPEGGGSGRKPAPVGTTTSTKTAGEGKAVVLPASGSVSLNTVPPEVANMVAGASALTLLVVGLRNSGPERQAIEDAQEEAKEEEVIVDKDSEPVKPVGELVRSIREQIAEIDAKLAAFSDEEMKGLLEDQRNNLEEMLHLAEQNDL